jgi:hypothetical protein
MESAKGTFFELGSVQPTPALRELLQVLAQDLEVCPINYLSKGTPTPHPTRRSMLTTIGIYPPTGPMRRGA